MSKQATKKPKAVIAAEAALHAKAHELEAVRETLRRVEREHVDARAAVREAWRAADAGLPQCRMVRVAWRGGILEEVGGMVILRKTPGGQLIARHVGDPDWEGRFKWNAFDGVFVQAEKRGRYDSERQLRDVPKEFMPATASAVDEGA